jgi:phosphonate degradation associated HDIG domain protein
MTAHATASTTFIDRILTLYRERGAMQYDGEGATQMQHGAQAASLAAAAGATPALQLAAWLHDIGHLLSGLPGTPTLADIDDRHETFGAAFLATGFGPAVSRPVALHVEAKRYLVGATPGYHARLSPDSCRSLALQGGPMPAADRAAFIALPFADDALRLRAWDEAAKRPGYEPGRIEDLERLLRLVASEGAAT